MTIKYPDGGTEALAVALDHGALSLRYTWQRRTEYLSVLAGRNDRLEFCWRRETTGGPLVETTFVQPSRGDMTLTIHRTGQTKVTYCVPGVWHLAALHPNVCMEHVVPIMELLCADSPIRLEVKQLRGRLFQTARKPLPVQRWEVEQLVRQLAARRFQERHHADQRLRTLGPSVISFLDELDPSALDREQRHRIAMVKADIWRYTADTPDRVAQWLSTDKQVWIALTHVPNSVRRELAMSRLANLSVAPVAARALDKTHARQAAVARDDVRRR